MKIDVEEQAGIKVLRLDGELGDDAALVETATDLLKSRGTRLVLDLGQVRHMNSAGLGVLVRITAQANTQECRVALARPSAFVAGVLQVTKLDRFFDVYDSVADALRVLGQAT